MSFAFFRLFKLIVASSCFRGHVRRFFRRGGRSRGVFARNRHIHRLAERTAIVTGDPFLETRLDVKHVSTGHVEVVNRVERKPEKRM